MKDKVYAGHEKLRYKHDDRNRGPSPIAIDAGRRPRTESQHEEPVGFLTAIPIHAEAHAATLAMHEALARQWGSLNQYCSNVLCLACPYYVFPFEFMQQYFSIAFGCRQQWVSEPVGQKQMRSRGAQPQQGAGETYMPDGRKDCRCPVTEQAMDTALGATTEMWFEMIRVDSPDQRTERRRVLSAAA